MSETETDATGGREPTQYRRIANTRPIGGVQCSRCGESKNSGKVVTFGISHGTFPDDEREKELLCDGCLRSLREWYDAREADVAGNTLGYVATKWGRSGE